MKRKDKIGNENDEGNGINKRNSWKLGNEIEKKRKKKGMKTIV